MRAVRPKTFPLASVGCPMMLRPQTCPYMSAIGLAGRGRFAHAGGPAQDVSRCPRGLPDGAAPSNLPLHERGAAGQGRLWSLRHLWSLRLWRRRETRQTAGTLTLKLSTCPAHQQNRASPEARLCRVSTAWAGVLTSLAGVV
jgi:hypothetical protein